MAQSSDRMRFKDKIIANIAKAIKGIQEAVHFKSQTTGDKSRLVLRNNDRQCHKLCENLDHVFLHGLKQHSNGYWKVVTEYTHKNAVRDIRNLRSVTTDLGRGRAWIFVALNDSLLESYIRNVTEHTKTLKKHYAKDALLLDQPQMSLLLTLTSGLECADFELEYDLPYLDLTAYPPRTRTASEIEEEAYQMSATNRGSFSPRPDCETAASTPESSKVLTDSDTASLSSLDTSAALRSSSTRVSSVSMDSGFPGDSGFQSSKQRSVTPTDTTSISSHGSAGEPDRLTRLENIVSTKEEVEEEDMGLEVLRVKNKKKSSGNKRKKSGSSKKNSERVVSPVSQISSATVVELSVSERDRSRDILHSSAAPIEIMSPSGNGVRTGDSNERNWSSYGKSPSFGKSPPSRESPFCSLPNGDGLAMEKASPVITSSVEGKEETQGSVSRSLEKNIGRLAAETKDSLADRFAQLDTTVANIRATATTLHQLQDQKQQLQRPSVGTGSVIPGQNLPPLQTDTSAQLSTSPQTLTASEDCNDVYSSTGAIICDNDLNSLSALVPEQNSEVPEVLEDTEKKMSALEEMESKCAQICKPVNSEIFDKNYGDEDSVNFTESAKDNSLARSETSIPLDGNVESRNGTETGFHQDRMPDKVSFEKMHREDEDEIDFYNAPDKVGVTTTDTHSRGQLQDYVDYISGHHDSQSVKDVVEVRQEENQIDSEAPRRQWTQDYALRLDNNTKLQIMLEIFSRDDEEFTKMFVTREGHSEGDLKVTFVLVTNYTLYLLKQKDSDRKFETELAIPLKDLNFISLSLNRQIVNIESSGSNRRKERIWLTPANQLLAQQILDCLESSIQTVHQPTSLKSHFSVGSDEPLQIIALRKYIARDSNCEENEVEIEDYSLVFWEDTQSNKNKQTPTAREGTMLLRVNDPFKGHVWKPVYVVLRDFMLCLFADKNDSRPQHYVRLGGEQCVGCRLDTSQDRPHCIEIILAKGGSWFLSVASEEEVASWRQSLCLAVSEGMQDSTNLSCLPCVSVVTGQKLLLCHEDVQTKFCRTIASAKVEEVTALTLDPEINGVNTYCILEFESQEIGVSSEQWVLYFNSPLEMDRFVQALSRVWKEVYQVPLAAGDVEDLPLQKHCQDQVSLLQHALTMK